MGVTERIYDRRSAFLPLLGSVLLFIVTACNVNDTVLAPNYTPTVEISYTNSSVSTSSASLFSGSPATITLSLLDTGFNPYIVTDAIVSFSVMGGTSTGTLSPVVNNEDGTYTASFTGVTAGTATFIHAFVNGNEIQSAAPSITVTSGNYSLSRSSIILSASSVIVGSAITATLTVRDSAGNTGSGGFTVLFSTSGGTGTGTFGATTDQGDGTYSATFTAVGAGTAVGVGASIQGNAVTVLPTLSVIDNAPSSLAYSSNPAVYTKDVAIASNSPSSGGGAPNSYSITPALPLGLTLNGGTGIISGTPTSLQSATSYTVTASNTGGSTSTTISIAINDVVPSGLAYFANPATYTKGSAITNNTPSYSGGSVISYSITPSLPAGLNFSVTTGIVSGTPTAVSATTSYTITATNSGGSASASLSLTVIDVAPSNLTYNTTNAVYSKGSAIASNSPSSLGGPIISYSISPALPSGLNLNLTSGVISGTPSVISSATVYTVTATNSGGSITGSMSITVQDVAPSSLTYANNPVIFTKGSAVSDSPTNSGGAATSYSVSPALPAGLSLNTSTGVVTGTPTVFTGATNYTVTATNTGGSTTASLSIAINDIAPSSLSYSTNPAVYTKNSAVTANTPANSGGAVVSYSISPGLPAGLSFNTTTGVISGTPSAISASTSYTITATNTGGSNTASLSITVNDIPPSTLTYGTNPATYTLGTAIAANTTSNSGGVITSYSVSPSLPAGLSLNTSSGTVSGTPSAITSTATYTVTGVSSGGNVTASLIITVNDAAPSALTYSATSLTGTKNSAIAADTVTNSGGTVTSYSVSPSLSLGLSFNTGTGTISGTPTSVSGSSSYTVTALNTGGSTSASLTIAINDIAPSALTYATASPVYTKGLAISNDTSSNAGGTVISYSVSPGLPNGLSLNTSTGVISGTPNGVSSATSYTVTATNSGGSTTSSLSITVNDVVASNLVYSSDPAVYTKGSAIASNTPTSSGGAVTSYSITPTLPTGLNLNTSSGIITGTPSAVTAAAEYTISAVNSGGTVTDSVSITVNDVAPSSLTYSSNPATYVKGTAITSNTPTHSGGAITGYSVSPSLPSGLSLNSSTGVISGTPTAVIGTASYTVSALNSGGSTSVGVSLTVNDTAPTSLTYSSNPATYTTGYAITSDNPSNAGGTITGYAVSPALPTGLSLSATTGVISGTPSAVTAIANYTVTATDTGGNTTASVSITVGSPSIAVATGGGQSGTAGSPLPGYLVAVVKDAAANVLPNVAVTWAVTAGGGTLSSCTTTTNSSGQVQCIYTLGTATGSNTITATAAIAPTPATFTESASAGSATQLLFTTEPASSGTTSTGFASTVKIEDSNGNTLTTSSSAVAIAAYTNSDCSGPAPGVLNGTLSQNASSGVASFSGLSYTKAQTIYLQATSSGLTSACSTAIAVGAGAITQLLLTGPVSLTAGACSSAYGIQTQDQYGNPSTVSGATTVTLSGGGAGTFYSDACTTSVTSVSIASGNGSQSFYFQDNTAQSGTLTAAAASITSGTLAVSISAGAAAKLVFTASTSASAVAGTAFGTQPVVAVEDTNGNVVTTATTSITLSAYTNSTCTAAATTALGGTTTLSASSGVAAFSGINYTVAGSLYIKATGATFTKCSGLFPVSAAAAYQLSYTVSPSSTGTAGAALATQPTLSVVDGYGNVVTSASGAVTIKAYSDSACGGVVPTGTLSATTNPLTATSGVAAFQGTQFTLAGTIYLGASYSGVWSACSNAITLSPPAPTKLVIKGGTGPIGGLCTAAYTLTSTDANGNASNVSANKTINLTGMGSGLFYADSACSTSVTSLSIASGTNTQNFYFEDATSESLTFTATDTTSSLTAGTLAVSVKAITQVVGGTDDTCAIVGGSMECWGNNGANEFSNGSFSSSLVPVLGASTSGISILSAGNAFNCGIISGAVKCWGNVTYTANSITSGATAVSAGGSHACAIVSGAAWCWGVNTYGQLGNNSVTNSSVPVQVQGLTANVTAIATGNAHSCAVVSGAVYCWGYNYYGQLGNSSITASSIPVQVSGLTTGANAVTAGESHSCAIVSGAVKCWGYGSDGELGNGAYTTSHSPVSVSGLTSGVTAISAGAQAYHTCALKGGGVQCWGSNNNGQLGNNSVTNSNIPVQVSGITTGATSIGDGAYHSCAIVSGAIKCWGQSYNGQLNNGVSSLYTVPQQVYGLSSGVTGIAKSYSGYGGYENCAIVNGGAQCWGGGFLGNGTNTGSTIPVQATGLTSGVTQISQADSNVCVVVNGAAQCWGNNNNGQLGNNSTTTSFVATPVSGLTSGVTAIGTGAGFACAIVSGSIECWGINTYGTLGNNSTTTSLVPVTVTGVPTTAVALSVAGSTVCAAFSDGSAWCWGTNGNGELGNNSTTSSLFPVQVQGLGAGSGVISVGGGALNSYALLNTGTIFGWGLGAYGQLGDNVGTQELTPVQMLNIPSGATFVSGQGCAIVSGGLRCMGQNSTGQVGNNSLSNVALPTQVQGMTSGVTDIGGTGSSNCAVMNGAAYCWGQDISGELGINGNYQNPVPVTAIGPFL